KPGKDVAGEPLPPGAVARLGSLRFRHGGWLRGISLSADGTRLATVGGYDKVRLWDAASGEERWSFTIPERSGGDGGGAPCADGQTLAIGGFSGVAVVEIASGKVVLEIVTARVACLAFSPDGKAVAAGGLRGGVTVWETATGKVLLTADAGASRGVANTW